MTDNSQVIGKPTVELFEADASGFVGANVLVRARIAGRTIGVMCQPDPKHGMQVASELDLYEGTPEAWSIEDLAATFGRDLDVKPIEEAAAQAYEAALQAA